MSRLSDNDIPPETVDHANGSTRRLEFQIYLALHDLVDVVNRVTEHVGRNDLTLEAGISGHLAVTTLDQELTAWYRNLPHGLKDTPSNLQNCPFSLYLLQ